MDPFYVDIKNIHKNSGEICDNTGCQIFTINGNNSKKKKVKQLKKNNSKLKGK